MAFQSAQSARASIGLLNASGYTRQAQSTCAAQALEVTTLADRAKVFIPGQTMGDGSFDMVLDTTNATNSQFAVLHTWKSTTPTPLDFAPEGYATGNPVMMYNAIETQVTTQAAVGATVDAKVTFIAADDVDCCGFSVEDYTALTITTTGTARDSGIVGGTVNGGVAHLHITSISNTSDTVTIEHSVDGSTAWATLVTFTAVTGAGGPSSQRVVVAPGTSVRKFLRVIDTIVGAGTTVRQVSFARR
jgi:hypothetical protein